MAKSGAAFLPGLRVAEIVSAIANRLDIPVNIMGVPGMPAISELFAAGCRRCSLGSTSFQLAHHHARKGVHQFSLQGQTASLFNHEPRYPTMNAALNKIRA
ncbi:MAG: hypothetical protein KGM99_03430 [Burkholderiales bacterium]|nr:hypothetical protein [Burkholderiales bacterium]